MSRTANALGAKDVNEWGQGKRRHSAWLQQPANGGGPGLQSPNEEVLALMRRSLNDGRIDELLTCTCFRSAMIASALISVAARQCGMLCVAVVVQAAIILRMADRVAAVQSSIIRSSRSRPRGC